MASEVKTQLNTKQYIIEHIQQALCCLSDPGVSESAYDIGWVARITEGNLKPLFPSCLYWILENQKEDGSWGAEAEYYHDRIISTLSCILALHQYNSDRRYNKVLEKAEKYICDNIENLSKDAYATVGFELIFPKLMDDAWNKGLCLSCQYSPVAAYLEKRKKKLSKLGKYVQLRPTTVLHSLECFDDDFDFESILRFQARNGSFLNSPSSTAVVYLQTGDDRCLEYIENVVNLFDGKVPVNYPLDIFRANWILDDIYEFELEDYFHKDVHNLTAYILENWTEKGLSWSKDFDLPDLDNTSVGYRNLLRAGHVISENVFKNFFDGEKFYCFEGELDSGPSHIANFLNTLQLMPETAFVKKAKEVCIQELQETRGADWSWSDKWHISKLYVTGRVFSAMRSDDIWAENIKTYFDGINALFNLTRDEELYLSRVYGCDMFSQRTTLLGSKKRKLWIDKVLYRLEL